MAEVQSPDFLIWQLQSVSILNVQMSKKTPSRMSMIF